MSDCAGPLRAIIDVGSNSVLLLLAARDGSGRVQAREDRATVTRLSAGLHAEGRLALEPMRRTVECIRGYLGEAARAGAEPVLVATEAVRAATNGEEFVALVRRELGHELRVLSGTEEAALSFRSVIDEFDHGAGSDGAAAKHVRVLDIGGASTELAVGTRHGLESSMSHALGSVRLTDAFLHHDPPQAAEIDALDEHVRALLSRQPLVAQPRVIGLAGTVTAAAALLLGLARFDRDAVHGTAHDIASILALRDRLARMTSSERQRLACLGPGRGDVAVAGISILVGVLAHCGAQTLVVADRGLRWALV